MRRPKVSVLVVVGTEPGAEERTLRSVRSLERQVRIEPGDIQVLRVAADATLADLAARTHGDLVGFLLGAPLLTVRVVQQALGAAALFEHVLIVVPAYEVESSLDSAVADTPSALFESATFAPANPNGYLTQLAGAEAFFVPASTLKRALADGAATVDQLAVTLLARPEVRLIALGGEGAFRPKGNLMPAPSDAPKPRAREVLVYGSVPGEAREMLRRSVAGAALRHAVLLEGGKKVWPLDPTEPASARVPSGGTPELSVIVVGFAIPRQLENTLHSLSPVFQQNVAPDVYEVVLVENRSPAMLGEERARAFGPHVRYFAREEAGISPAPALNFGITRARGRAIALMIDGARMVSPRVIEHTLLALRAHPRPLVVVPGYHLGPAPQHVSSLSGYDEKREQALLESVGWKDAGYRLFEIAAFDEATENGFLSPLLEATFLACPRECLEAISGVDERFVTSGGGIVNLDLFERLCRLDGTRCVMLWGEGNFHQYHGGVSSRGGAAREKRLELFRSEYEGIHGRPYAGFDREPALLGVHSSYAAPLLELAAKLGTMRHGMILKMGRAEWPNE